MSGAGRELFGGVRGGWGALRWVGTDYVSNLVGTLSRPARRR